MFTVDKPGKPKGPLDIVDIYADRAALLWDKPDNDGGEPITHYVVEMKEGDGDWKKVGYVDSYFHVHFIKTVYSLSSQNKNNFSGISKFYFEMKFSMNF